MSKDEAIAKAWKAGLNGGRTYGISQHKVAIKTLANLLMSGEGKDEEAIIDAIVSISNISATQQKLANMKLIDRASREAQNNNILKQLMAD